MASSGPPAAADPYVDDPSVLVYLGPSPLSLERFVEHASLQSTGAVVSFLGLTRTPGHGGKGVACLQFEAYEPMALRGLRAIAGEARGRFSLSRVAIGHRLGSVPLGQASLCVCVSSPHRKPAMDASPYIVEQIKQRVAVWKKEVYEDGSHWWVKQCC